MSYSVRVYVETENDGIRNWLQAMPTGRLNKMVSALVNTHYEMTHEDTEVLAESEECFMSGENTGWKELTLKSLDERLSRIEEVIDSLRTNPIIG